MTHNNALDLEKDLLNRLRSNNPQRGISALTQCAWGHYITPAPDEHPEKSNKGLRLLVIGSWTLGMLAFEGVKELEDQHPDTVNITGLVTDDPLDPDAKISMQKRFWHYYRGTRQEKYVFDLMEEALEYGVPCYTGEVKSDTFRSYLTEWKPDAIIVSAFGQLIDKPIIDFPTYGIYNVHPADLLNGFGAGTQPWEDLIDRQAETTRVTIHKVSEEIDAGSVVGFSPLLNVRLAHNLCTDDICLVGEKTLIPVKFMIKELILKLCQKKESGKTGPIDSIDFEGCFSPADQATLMLPIDPEQRGHILPLSPQHAEDTV